MVRPLLDGRKTQTRRIVKFPFIDKDVGCELSGGELAASKRDIDRHSPYGAPGDLLWVKETYCPVPDFGFAYRATTDNDGERCRRELGLHWKPSIFCTRKASRITLEIENVRVERLQNISENDARQEGGPPILGYHADGKQFGWPSYRIWYRDLWLAINGTGSWGKNPWVWVITFKRISPSINSTP